MNIIFASAFVREYKRLSKALQVEVKEKIELFRTEPQHSFLRTHKLKGRLKGKHSFSVNYKYRIVFVYQKIDAVFLMVGDHDVYN